MFGAALEATPPGNKDVRGRLQIGIYIDDPEITPHIAHPGEHRFRVGSPVGAEGAPRQGKC